MKFYSENLDRLFDSAEDLEMAETEAARVKAEKEEAEAKKKEERKARADEVTAAYNHAKEVYKQYQDAYKDYEKLLADFLRDYKSYHYTVSTVEDINDLFDSVFNIKLF